MNNMGAKLRRATSAIAGPCRVGGIQETGDGLDVAMIGAAAAAEDAKTAGQTQPPHVLGQCLWGRGVQVICAVQRIVGQG